MADYIHTHPYGANHPRPPPSSACCGQAFACPYFNSCSLLTCDDLICVFAPPAPHVFVLPCSLLPPCPTAVYDSCINPDAATGHIDLSGCSSYLAESRQNMSWHITDRANLRPRNGAPLFAPQNHACMTEIHLHITIL